MIHSGLLGLLIKYKRKKMDSPTPPKKAALGDMIGIIEISNESPTEALGRAV